MPVYKAQAIYAEAVKAFPEELKQYTFDIWLSYLVKNELLLRHPSEMLEITTKGKDFLKYLTHWGRDDKLKRL